MQPILVLAVCLCALVSGCGEGKHEPNDNAGAEVHPIVKTVQRGPVKMTVTADKNRVTIAEQLTLTVEVFAEDGVDVELDEPGEGLHDFQVRDMRHDSAKPVEGGRRWTRTYGLDVFLSGEYAIPELEARFVDRREEDSVTPGERAREGTIHTESFTIEVTSLQKGEFDPTQFHDIKGPVELPVEASRRLASWAVGAALVVALAAVLIVLRRRRRGGAKTQVVVVPHEWAFDQLRLLSDENLVEQGRVHEFYFRLSRIVRVYIELRFGLMAPERTTEEFLVEVHRSDTLRIDHKTLLGDFLRSADLVKFARYEPTASEIESAFDSARDFIEQTVPSGDPLATQASEQAA